MITSELPPQHIVALAVNNFKRVKAIQITLAEDAKTVVLSGDNATGKSSVLDAIWVAVAGKRVAPDDPIRHGTDKASITAETQDLIITRRFTPKDSYLDVTRRNGDKVASPQSLLDELITAVGFDPMAFSAMAPTDQAEQLVKICGAGIDLDANAAKATEAYEDRTVANRIVGQIESQLKGMPDVPVPEQVDIAEMEAKLANLTAAKQAAAVERERVKGMQARAATLILDMQEMVGNIALAQKRFLGFQDQLEVDKAESSALDAEIDKITAALTPDGGLQGQIDELADNIAKQRAANSAAAEASGLAEARAAKVLELKNATKEATSTDDKLAALKADRAAAIAAMEFPIDGLGIDDNGRVTYNKVLLSQASSAEQIRVGISVAAAAAPGLRVCFIRNGSLLDKASMQEVAALAAEKDIQVWIERVDDNSPAALQIVDGGIVGQE